MIAKEKAESLVEKFLPHTLVLNKDTGWLEGKDEAKQCALIAVDEILLVLTKSEYFEGKLKLVKHVDKPFWEEVKQEIQKL